MKRILFVYNPLSGLRNLPRKLDTIIRRFWENDILVQPFRICGDEQDKLLSVIENGDFIYVVVSGGDGTVSLVINTLLKNGIKLPVGLIPSGTCNDFAGSLGIPAEVRKCLDIILAGNTAEVDVGLINEERFFLNTCAGGNLVDASFNTSSELKRNIGPLAYYLKAVSELTNIKPVRLRIVTDDETVEQDSLFFLIINGRHAGGFSNLLQDADIADGLMDVLLLKNCPHIELPSLVIKVLSNDFIYDRNVVWLRTGACRIEGSGDIPVSLDGERGGGLPINVRFLKRALKVFVK
jgi:YegS/Rv2252/BmrU family lipid kinase